MSSRHAPEVQLALDVLRAAGWRVEESVGYGRLSGDFLVSEYAEWNSRHVAVFAREPWCEQHADTDGSGQAGDAL